MAFVTSIKKEILSMFAPSKTDVSDVPQAGDMAPLDALQLGSKPTVLVFLRHCGCPFAEKTFTQMKDAASFYKDVNFIAISHSDQESTDTWVDALGGPGDISKVVVDAERRIYGAYGLGVTGWGHLVNKGMVDTLGTLKKEGISNRWTESGSRWQSSGAFAVDGKGIVRWSKPAPSAEYIPDLQEAVKTLDVKSKI